MPDWLALLCRVVLLLGLPVALTLMNVRLLMTHTWADLQYNVLNVPPDPFGFTRDDRLYWSKRSIDFILGNPRAGAIESWKFSDEGRAPAGYVAPAPETCADYGDRYGPRDCTYFYNDREVLHMLDVRVLTAAALTVWVVTGLLVLLALGALVTTGQTATLRLSLLNGAALTWGLFIFVAAFIGLNFNGFFTLFHQVLFADGTWTFYWSDSLIRLFPLQFWFNTFLFVTAATLGQAAIIAAIAWWGLRT
jgi:integral membrane protein (TIGR01906 family)